MCVSLGLDYAWVITQLTPLNWSRAIASMQHMMTLGLTFQVALTQWPTCSCPSWERRQSMTSTAAPKRHWLGAPPWSVSGSWSFQVQPSVLKLPHRNAYMCKRSFDIPPYPHTPYHCFPSSLSHRVLCNCPPTPSIPPPPKRKGRKKKEVFYHAIKFAAFSSKTLLCVKFQAQGVPCLPEIVKYIRASCNVTSLEHLSSTSSAQSCMLCIWAIHCLACL